MVRVSLYIIDVRFEGNPLTLRTYLNRMGGQSKQKVSFMTRKVRRQLERKLQTVGIIPLEKSSQIIMNGLNDHEHRENNLWFESMFEMTKNGGVLLVPGLGISFQKVSKGWKILN